jgi:hypothetical protein
VAIDEFKIFGQAVLNANATTDQETALGLSAEKWNIYLKPFVSLMPLILECPPPNMPGNIV